MDKNLSHLEKKWYQFWQKEGYFQADPKSPKPGYSLLMPPPNLTGEPHLGHAMQHAILDALARFKRMEGFDVLLQPGVDHAGIQFEGTLNKILAKEDLSKEKLGREKWLERAWQFKNEIYQSFHQTWTIMGISADWSREVFTLDPQVGKAVFAEFLTFWEQDLLYKGAYLVQWCPKCGTAIEDLEMEYQDRLEKLYFVKYQIKDTKDQFIIIATARPETIYADTAIAIYPHHPKFAKFLGQQAVSPLTERLLPIIEDKRVEKNFGTGALKITPGHDLLDFAIGIDHGLSILHAIDKSGRMSESVGNLAGLKAEEAREKVVEILQKKRALKKVEDFRHAVPVCERCKTTVEPLISEEWFVKMKPLADKALKHLKEINLLPKNYQKIIVDWLKEIHDWSISRSLWWGFQIPVWYCQDCNPSHKVGKDQDMVVSWEKPKQACQTCQGHHWVQDEQVLDTWFSSGMWPLATLGWSSFAKASDDKPAETPEFKKYFPWNFELSASDIKYLWIARMIMLSLYFQKQIPFKNMFFHGTLRDLQGRKFSKSLGNGIDPFDLIKTWGVDATRMVLYSYAAPGRDARTSRQIFDERGRSFRNFETKLRNISRFIVELKPENNVRELTFSHADDVWIKKELERTITKVTDNLEHFHLHLASDEIYVFIWHKLADVYLEKSKKRRIEAQPVLEYVFKTALELLHPFMPFITEELWQQLPHSGKSIMIASWPKAK